MWGATTGANYDEFITIFQSTPPVWGATDVILWVESSVCISIHAPRVGGDRLLAFTIPPKPISIHAPRVGGDVHPSEAAQLLIGISIHAPRVGGDYKGLKCQARLYYFNPRPPCGGRQQKQLKIQAVRAKNRQFLQISSPNSYPILKNKVASLQIILQNLVRDLGDFLRVYVSHLKHQYIFWVVGCLYSKMLDLVFIAVSQVIKTKTVLFRVHDLTQLCL